ncbi:glucuronate isomerase [Clostridium cellulovorans]|uniref:Uronate isomerase n=1 Tax=Clostridium cellulovorans (strain ATCC 35296 / DSM 3052 / OCM 3 / 743B) TaxID=573061 RepID=D9SP23_CLOC7|nr:glucuronate isomerase [Clostridium cellulovorans]ADL51988.1 Glucuronate isomerase [Clostridium cellulovorans 743B]
MKEFMGEDFLLSTETAKTLYNEYAKDMPIFDYHCHLIPEQIATDKKYNNITEIWLYGDHYKWRAMRSYGVDEKYITGDASDFQKFKAFASVMPYLIGNPIYHWSHLELRRYFGVTEVLSEKNAEEIWNKCNEVIKSSGFSAKSIIMNSNVKYIGTTDDPADSLEFHQEIASDKNFTCEVRPSWRPDKAVKIGNQDFAEYIKLLGATENTTITSYAKLLDVLKKRLKFFVENGCTITDHAMDRVYFRETTEEEVDSIFKKALAGQALSQEAIEKYVTLTMIKLSEMYHELGMILQLHIGALRNNNSRMFKKLGPDIGFDSIDDGEIAQPLSKLLDALESQDKLPKTILYCLNPKDNEVLATMLGNFQGGGIASKIQFGSGWWFLDQKDGMIKQLTALSQLGLVSKFVGMLTDSRSFLSYTRHEYFRRILCNYLGELVENGEYPADMEVLGQVVRDICYNNAVIYFKNQK